MADEHNPQNAPDPEEREILQKIENGQYVYGDAEAAGYYDPEIVTDTREAEINIKEAFEEMLPGLLDNLKDIFEDLNPYIDKELQKPEYGGEKNLGRLLEKTKVSDRLELYKKILKAAQEAKKEAEAGEEEARLEPIPLQSPGTPKGYYLPLAKFYNDVLNLDGEGELVLQGNIDDPIFYKDKPNEISINANITYLPTMPKKYLSAGPFPELPRLFYDMVFSAYASIYKACEKAGLTPVCTPDILCRWVRKRNKTVTPRLQEDVIFCFDYMTNLFIDADASDDIAHRKIKELNGVPLKGYQMRGEMIPVSPIIFDLGGGREQAGYILRKSPLLEYAEITGQITYVKADLFDIRELEEINGKIALSNFPIATSRYRDLADLYLIKRIKAMKNNEERARKNYRTYVSRQKKKKEPIKKTLDSYRGVRTILYSTVFEQAGATNKNTQTDLRKYIPVVVENQRLRGEIKGFTLRKSKKGAGYDAVDITV